MSPETAQLPTKSLQTIGWLRGLLSIIFGSNGASCWTRTSDMLLRAVEKRILSSLKLPYRGSFVDIGPVVGNTGDKIWTVAMNETSPKTPLVMLHGFAAATALWCLNLDSLAANRPVYAIDVLGFGRSSRPSFSRDASKAEEQFVTSVEEWRREMNIDKFILLGHSLGGYIATSYALKYPNRVCHLILADPWGVVERPGNWREKYQLSFWVRAAVAVVRPFNPLFVLRAVGPAGPWLVEKLRPDIVKKFTLHMSDVPDVDKLIPMYLHQCNAQTPSGESAFHSMMNNYGWAQNPMELRLPHLNPKLSMTIICGSRSWLDIPTEALKTAGTAFASENGVTANELPLTNRVCRSEMKVINGAGHHVYLDKPEIFNKYVNEACEIGDSQENLNTSIRNNAGSYSDTESNHNNS